MTFTHSFNEIFDKDLKLMPSFDEKCLFSGPKEKNKYMKPSAYSLFEQSISLHPM